MNSGLAAFLLRRVLLAILFIAIVSTSALILARLAPGDATTELSLSGVDAATVARTREALGLNRPIVEQVGHWFAGLVRFDLGQSSRYQRPVSSLLRDRVGNTALLAAVACALATLIGVPLGILTGAKPHGVLAAIITPISLALVSCPPIVGALGLLLLALTTGWMSVAPGHLVLPALALALPIAAMLERVQSQATSESLTAPHLTAAAARGIPRTRLIWVHASRDSLRPVLGIYGIVIGGVFSGSLAVEWVTSWPGLGNLMYTAIVSRDVLLTAGCALVGAILIALGNLIGDLLRGLADPRVRA